MIEGTVITTRSPVTRCFLGHHMKCRSPITGGRTDDALLEHVLEVLFGCFEVFWR